MRKIYQFLAFFIFLFVSYPLLMAQGRAVRGVVVDSEGETLPGVSVVVKGTTQGTVTDIDGKFTVSVPEKTTLVFSYVGFQPREIEVVGQEYMDVVLEVSSVMLDEVVAIAYGKQSRALLTNSISQVGE